MASVNLGTGVLPGTNAVLVDAVAGAVILAGQLVYKDTNNNSVAKLAVGTSQLAATVFGVAMNSAPTIGQPVKVQISGDITGTAALTAGLNYCVSAATPGSVAPEADLVSTNYGTEVCQALTANSIRLNIFAPGVAKP